MSENKNGSYIHPLAKMFAKEYKSGFMSRREFMSRATAVGVSATMAYSLIGYKTSNAAKWVNPPKMGGTLRIQQEVKALKDPRTFDWSAGMLSGLCMSAAQCELTYRFFVMHACK